MVGRFSGRNIDYYEWHREQYDEEANPEEIEPELRAYWRDKHPEFCVQSWCFVPDPLPDFGWAEEDKREMRSAYAEWISHMKAKGATLCEGVRHPRESARKGDRAQDSK